MKFWKWLAASPIATFVKVFIAVILGAAVADWSDAGDINFADWKVWVISALVAAIPVIVNWLNPQYGFYGRGRADAIIEVR